MKKQERKANSMSVFHPIGRVDVQVSIFAGAVAVLSCLITFFISYHLTYHNITGSLASRVQSIHSYAEQFLEEETFSGISEAGDMDSELYQQTHDLFYKIKVATGVEYLYTAKRTEDGQLIYVVDGMDPGDEAFRRPGDPVESEIAAELERALEGEAVWPEHIKDTQWGKVFVAYVPFRGANGVIGAVGVEFSAESQYDTYFWLRVLTPMIALVVCLLTALCAAALFRRVSNPTFQDLANTDWLTGLKSRNAYEVDVNNLDTRRQQQGMGMCLMDLDHLKWVNDHLGHQSGDEYLRCVSAVIRDLAPKGGAVYRIGGDEFALLVRDMTLETLQDWGASASEEFRRRQPDWNADLSLAVGCAVFEPDRDSSMEQVYLRADREMYAQKQANHQRQSR